MSGLNNLKLLALGLVSTLPLLLAGCDQTKATAQVTESDSQKPELVLHVGLPPDQNLFSLKTHYQPLMDYLSQETGIDFKLHIVRHNSDLIDNLSQHNLDMAFFDSFTGALAARELGVISLVHPQSVDGESTCYGMVFVRKDSGIKNADNLRGKRLVLVDRATTAGYLLPLAYFNSIGISNYSAWFKKFYFSGTDEDAILEVLHGYADIGAAKSWVFSRLAKKDPRILQELEILAISPRVPTDSLAVRKDLSEELIKLITEKLLRMHQNGAGRAILKEFGAKKFVPTSSQDFQPVFGLAAHIGLDLSTFNYRND